MGLLSGGNYAGECEPISKMTSECKPDYEAMIKRAKEKKQKAQRFREAIFDFLEDRRTPDALVNIVGELDFEIWGFDKTIDNLIDQQEKEK